MDGVGWEEVGDWKKGREGELGLACKMKKKLNKEKMKEMEFPGKPILRGESKAHSAIFLYPGSWDAETDGKLGLHLRHLRHLGDSKDVTLVRISEVHWFWGNYKAS